MKLQDSSFKNESETGDIAKLTSTDKIYVTALSLNKTLEEAIIANDLGGPAISAIVTNSALNSYDMSATAANTIIRHQASSGVMYQLPTASQGKKFFFVNEGVNPSGGTVLTVSASNNKIDFTRGGTPFTATLANATYNHGSSGVSGTLGTQIKTAMEAADGATTFTVTFDFSEKTYKITGSATYFFRFSTGANVANTSRFLIGFLGLDGSAALSQYGMSLHNEARVQSNTGDQIAYKNNLSITPGYIALRKRGVMIAVTAIDATTWEVEQVTNITHIKNTTIGDNVRELSIVGKDAWVTKATAGTARYGCIGWSLNGYGYSCNGVGTNEVNQYNDSANTWATKTSTNGSIRGYVAGFSLNGYGYVCNGYIFPPDSNEVSQYNDSTNAWATKATAGTARQGPNGFSLNGYGYVCNGLAGSYTNEVNKYNDSANTWSTVATGGTARAHMSAFALNGYGYICDGAGASYFNEVNQYNDSANTWTTKATAGTARFIGGGFALNGYGYNCLGSDSGAGFLSEINQYNDSTNIWVDKATGGTARAYIAGFSLNGYGYTCNGNGGSNSNEVNQYN